jgi:hypothetical protein
VTDDPYAPFRPRLARWVSLGIAVLVVIGTVAIVWAAGDFVGVGDQVGFAVVGIAVTWFCWRQASVAVRVDPDGLTVRNLVLSRRLDWAQVVSVRFGQGRPWVQLDLADGDTLAAMGVQRADGALAEREARRLATLLARHTTTGPVDD